MVQTTQLQIKNLCNIKNTCKLRKIISMFLIFHVEEEMSEILKILYNFRSLSLFDFFGLNTLKLSKNVYIIESRQIVGSQHIINLHLSEEN